MNRNDHKKQSGDTVAWISSGLTAHAEKQVATFEELQVKSLTPEKAAYTEMLDCVRAIATGNHDEWKAGKMKEMVGQDQLLKRLSQLIMTPSRAANAISSVVDEAPKVCKWRIVGDPKLVYCVKHCSHKAPSTRGHHYYDVDNERDLGLHCQKCVSELSSKKGVHQLRRLLERSGKLKRVDDRRGEQSKGRNEKRPSAVERAAALLGLSEPKPKPPTSVNLEEKSYQELRQIASDAGVEKLPRSKVKLIQVINELSL
jgi:hypothetical protein